MISQEELQAYLALNAQPNHPNVKGRPDTLSVSLTDKDKRIEELEKQLLLEKARNEALVNNIRDIRTFTDRLQSIVDSQSDELKSLRSSFESLLELQDRSQADNMRLTAYITLPWWKKIGSTLLLTDSSKNR